MELYREEDDRFSVRAWSEPGRNGRTRYRIRNVVRTTGAKRTFDASTAEAAIQEARALWAKYASGKLDVPAAAPMTLAALVDAWKAAEGGEKPERHAYSYTFAHLLAFVGEDRRPSSLCAADVRAWFASQDLDPSSEVNYATRIKSLFAWAQKRGWYPGCNPVAGISMTRPRRPIRTWIDVDDWPRYLAACSPEHRIRSEFALETGLRAGEVGHARWNWLHSVVGSGAITIQPDPASKWTPKKGKTRSVPLSERAEEVIAEARARFRSGDDAYIFSAWGRNPVCMSRAAILTTIACKAAKLATSCDFHGLRRSAGARWLQAGISLLEVSRLLGHDDIRTTAEDYAGIADRDLVAAIRRIGRASETRSAGNVLAFRGPKR